jgi:MFS superfamily sulfate permease-like transporter
VKHGIRWLPGLDTLRRYEPACLRHDIFAGLVLATMLVPVGIAYADELKDPVKDKLKRFGLFAQFGENYFFPTIGAAVSSYLVTNNDVEWQDWEDD